MTTPKPRIIDHSKTETGDIIKSLLKAAWYKRPMAAYPGESPYAGAPGTTRGPVVDYKHTGEAKHGGPVYLPGGMEGDTPEEVESWYRQKPAPPSEQIVENIPVPPAVKLNQEMLNLKPREYWQTEEGMNEWMSYAVTDDMSWLESDDEAMNQWRWTFGHYLDTKEPTTQQDYMEEYSRAKVREAFSNRLHNFGLFANDWDDLMLHIDTDGASFQEGDDTDFLDDAIDQTLNLAVNASPWLEHAREETYGNVFSLGSTFNRVLQDWHTNSPVFTANDPQGYYADWQTPARNPNQHSGMTHVRSYDLMPQEQRLLINAAMKDVPIMIPHSAFSLTKQDVAYSDPNYPYPANQPEIDKITEYQEALTNELQSFHVDPKMSQFLTDLEERKTQLSGRETQPGIGGWDPYAAAETQDFSDFYSTYRTYLPQEITDKYDAFVEPDPQLSESQLYDLKSMIKNRVLKRQTLPARVGMESETLSVSLREVLKQLKKENLLPPGLHFPEEGITDKEIDTFAELTVAASQEGKPETFAEELKLMAQNFVESPVGTFLTEGFTDEQVKVMTDVSNHVMDLVGQQEIEAEMNELAMLDNREANEKINKKLEERTANERRYWDKVERDTGMQLGMFGENHKDIFTFIAGLGGPLSAEYEGRSGQFMTMQRMLVANATLKDKTPEQIKAVAMYYLSNGMLSEIMTEGVVDGAITVNPDGTYDLALQKGAFLDNVEQLTSHLIDIQTKAASYNHKKAAELFDAKKSPEDFANWGIVKFWQEEVSADIKSYGDVVDLVNDALYDNDGAFTNDQAIRILKLWNITQEQKANLIKQGNDSDKWSRRASHGINNQGAAVAVHSNPSHLWINGDSSTDDGLGTPGHTALIEMGRNKFHNSVRQYYQQAYGDMYHPEMIPDLEQLGFVSRNNINWDALDSPQAILAENGIPIQHIAGALSHYLLDIHWSSPTPEIGRQQKALVKRINEGMALFKLPDLFTEEVTPENIGRLRSATMAVKMGMSLYNASKTNPDIQASLQGMLGWDADKFSAWQNNMKWLQSNPEFSSFIGDETFEMLYSEDPAKWAEAMSTIKGGTTEITDKMLYFLSKMIAGSEMPNTEQLDSLFKPRSSLRNLDYNITSDTLWEKTFGGGDTWIGSDIMETLENNGIVVTIYNADGEVDREANENNFRRAVKIDGTIYGDDFKNNGIWGDEFIMRDRWRKGLGTSRPDIVYDEDEVSYWTQMQVATLGAYLQHDELNAAARNIVSSLGPGETIDIPTLIDLLDTGMDVTKGLTFHGIEQGSNFMGDGRAVKENYIFSHRSQQGLFKVAKNSPKENMTTSQRAYEIWQDAPLQVNKITSPSFKEQTVNNFTEHNSWGTVYTQAGITEEQWTKSINDIVTEVIGDYTKAIPVLNQMDIVGRRPRTMAMYGSILDRIFETYPNIDNIFGLNRNTLVGYGWEELTRGTPLESERPPHLELLDLKWLYTNLSVAPDAHGFPKTLFGIEHDRYAPGCNLQYEDGSGNKNTWNFPWAISDLSLGASRIGTSGDKIIYDMDGTIIGQNNETIIQGASINE